MSKTVRGWSVMGARRAGTWDEPLATLVPYKRMRRRYDRPRLLYSVLRAGVIGRLGWCIDEIHPEPSDTAPLPSEGCAAVDSLSLLRSLGRVEAAARRMYALLLARLQAGRALLERQPLDLVALARRIVGAGLPTGP